MKKKLVLSKETLQLLSAPRLGEARGGSIVGPTVYSFCTCGGDEGRDSARESCNTFCTTCMSIMD